MEELLKTVKFKDKNENTDSRNVVDFLVSFFFIKNSTQLEQNKKIQQNITEVTNSVS